MAARKPTAYRSSRSEQNMRVFLYDETRSLEESFCVSTDEDDEQELIDSPEALEARVAGIKEGSIPSGPLLIARKMQRSVVRIPAFTTVIINSFGPTIDTITLSYVREPQRKQKVHR